MLRRFRYLIITILFLLPPLAVSISTGPAASEDHIHIEARKTIRVRVTQTFTPTLTRTPTTMPPTVTLTQTAIPTETPAPPTLTLIETLTLAPTQTMTPVSTMTFTPTQTNTPVPPTPTTTNINAVSIAELYQLHTDNKPAFESLYLDQFVQVSGWVSKIDDDRTVEVWNHSNEERVFCRVPEANIETLVPVRPGMHLTVLGKIAVERYVFLGQIIALQDCYVLDYSVPPTPTNTATSTPTDTPTITHTPLPPTTTPTPTLSPTITLTPVSALYEVGNTDGDGVYLREAAGGDERIKAWPDSTLMMVVGADTLIDGRMWRHVQDPDGNRGYVPVEYLVTHVPPTPVPTKTSTPLPTNTTTDTRAWYEGGTLHDSTIRQWRQANDRNKLATAGDWATTVLMSEQGIGLPSSLPELRVYARALVTCVDETVRGEAGDAIVNNKTSEIALLCAVLMGFTE